MLPMHRSLSGSQQETEGLHPNRVIEESLINGLFPLKSGESAIYLEYLFTNFTKFFECFYGDPGFIDPKAYIIGGPSLRKRIQKIKIKIRYMVLGGPCAI